MAYKVTILIVALAIASINAAPYHDDDHDDHDLHHDDDHHIVEIGHPVEIVVDTDHDHHDTLVHVEHEDVIPVHHEHEHHVHVNHEHEHKIIVTHEHEHVPVLVEHHHEDYHPHVHDDSCDDDHHTHGSY